jgi:hypothetical protein
MRYNTSKKVPVEEDNNTPLKLLGHEYHRKRRYTKSENIGILAIEKYQQTGNGITFADLLNTGLAKRKNHAQNTLKRCLQREILFTPENRKPQQYYPSSLKSEIQKKLMLKNTPVQLTVVSSNVNPIYPWKKNKIDSINKQTQNLSVDWLIIKTLEGYVLPLLPEAPLFIHKLHLKLNISLKILQRAQTYNIKA